MERVEQINRSDESNPAVFPDAGNELLGVEANGVRVGAVEIREISFESALDKLGGSYAGNVPACS